MSLKIIFTILIFITAECLTTSEELYRIDAKIQALRLRDEQRYGSKDTDDIQNSTLSVLPEENLPWSDSLGYPRGDKKKLRLISNLWLKYYSCCANAVRHLTLSGHRPLISRAVFEGAAVRIPCGLCVSPEERGIVTWLNSESLKDAKFEPMPEKETAVTKDDHLTVYHARQEDSGVYRCQVGDSLGGLVVVEVVDYEENYTVTKHLSPRGKHPAPSVIVGELKVFSKWSQWSECSDCGSVGRRRRYGMCHVRVNTPKKSHHQLADSQANGTICPSGLRLLEAFPSGLFCRSKYLPSCIRDLPVVRERPSEIMLGMCKVPCNTHEEQGANDFIETLLSDNHVARDIVFAARLEPAVVRCPGTVLRDAPVRWRVGTKHVVPLTLQQGSGGRALLNARDHIVFTEVYFSDAGVYSCWQDDRLAGVVKLHVWGGARGGRLCLIATCSVTLLVAAAIRRLLRARRYRFI